PQRSCSRIGREWAHAGPRSRTTTKRLTGAGYRSRVARTWGELLGDERADEEPEQERTGFFARLRDSLAKSRTALAGELASAAFDPHDDASWERLEEALIMADVGVPTTAELVRRLESRPDVSAGLEGPLAEEVAVLFGDPGRLDLAARPSVVLFVGVNGTGKTTTIGKLARRLREHQREDN